MCTICCTGGLRQQSGVVRLCQKDDANKTPMVHITSWEGTSVPDKHIIISKLGWGGVSKQLSQYALEQQTLPDSMCLHGKKNKRRQIVSLAF